MRVIGIGLDIVETERLKQTLARFGDRFLERVFLPAEITYAQNKARPYLHFAARFAAKEAVSKALGTGIGAQLSWHDMEVTRAETGKPSLRWHGAGLSLAESLGVTEVFLTLTHTDHYAAAQALLVGK